MKSRAKRKLNRLTLKYNLRLMLWKHNSVKKSRISSTKWKSYQTNFFLQQLLNFRRGFSSVLQPQAKMYIAQMEIATQILRAYIHPVSVIMQSNVRIVSERTFTISPTLSLTTRSILNMRLQHIKNSWLLNQ